MVVFSAGFRRGIPPPTMIAPTAQASKLRTEGFGAARDFSSQGFAKEVDESLGARYKGFVN